MSWIRNNLNFKIEKMKRIAIILAVAVLLPLTIFSQDREMVKLFQQYKNVQGFELQDVDPDIDFETDVVRDGLSASNWLYDNVPDLLVLDLHLPFLSGEDILNQVNADDRFFETRIMIVVVDMVYELLYLLLVLFNLIQARQIYQE